MMRGYSGPLYTEYAIAERDEEIGRLRQALWDIYGILGFDQDGDPTPVANRGDLAKLVVDAAREARVDPDAALDEILLSPRVAVVRPDDELARTVRSMIEDGHPCGSPAGDEWFQIILRRLREHEVAVVRPTRDSAMIAISNMLLDERALHVGEFSYQQRDDFARDIADAVFRVAVSDSQETPE